MRRIPITDNSAGWSALDRAERDGRFPNLDQLDRVRNPVGLRAGLANALVAQHHTDRQAMDAAVNAAGEALLAELVDGHELDERAVQGALCDALLIDPVMFWAINGQDPFACAS